MSSVVKLLTVIIALITWSLKAEQISAETLLSKLKEAEDYLSYSPEIASKTLKTYLPYVHQLTAEQELSWHQNLLRASITLTDLSQVERSVRAMLTLPRLTEYPDKYVSVLSSTGIFMRKLGHLEESIKLFDCGLQVNRLLARQKLSLLISKGHSLRQLNKVSEAKALYLEAIDLARLTNNQLIKSVTFNALGNTALDAGDRELAKYYFLNALNISQQISRRSGQMFSALYLMTIALIDNDFMLYQRLYSPTSLQVAQSENDDRKVHLFWLEKAHKVKLNKRLTAEERQQLKSRLSYIKEVKLHNMLAFQFGQLFDLELELKPKKLTRYQGSLMTFFNDCSATKSSLLSD